MKKRDSIIKTLRRRDVGVRVGYIIIFMFMLPTVSAVSLINSRCAYILEYINKSLLGRQEILHNTQMKILFCML